MPNRRTKLLLPIAIALAISLALHAALAVALALCLNSAPASDELAQLDLTSVDLSFAENVEETAAAVASAPSPPVDAAPSPRQTPPPADAAPSPRQNPSPADAAPSPRQNDVRLPSPKEMPELLPPVIVKQAVEAERQETRDVKPREMRDGKRHEARDEKPEPPLDASPAMAASAPRQARVDAPPKPRRAIKPDYPSESRLRGEHGDVALELDVAADGSVTGVRVIRSPGYPLLDAAAVKAARAARFTPAKSGGKPVASTARLTLSFRLK